MKFFTGMTQEQIEQFIMSRPVSGGCGTTDATDAAVADQKSFTSKLISQADKVFGAASSVFNTMKNAYTSIVNAGPSQQGFSAAQQSAMNAEAITVGANQTRFAEARLGGQQAGAGGGNAPNASGIGAGSRAQVAEAGAAATASELNKIQQENYVQGNRNWQIAGEELSKAPSAFNGVSEFNKVAQGGLDKNLSNAQAADAASNWWVKPVEGSVMAGISALTGGIGGGMASKVMGMGGGGSMIDAGSPQYMPGGGPDMSAPQGAFPGSVPGS